MWRRRRLSRPGRVPARGGRRARLLAGPADRRRPAAPARPAAGQRACWPWASAEHPEPVAGEWLADPGHWRGPGAAPGRGGHRACRRGTAGARPAGRGRPGGPRAARPPAGRGPRPAAVAGPRRPGPGHGTGRRGQPARSCRRRRRGGADSARRPGAPRRSRRPTPTGSATSVSTCGRSPRPQRAGAAAAGQRSDRARPRRRRAGRPRPGRAAAAVHRGPGQAGAADHAPDRDTAAGVPGPGRRHRAAARRPPQARAGSCAGMVRAVDRGRPSSASGCPAANRVAPRRRLGRRPPAEIQRASTARSPGR